MNNIQKNNTFFELLHSEDRIRLGIIRNWLGQSLETPAFIPVATNASIRALDSISVKNLGINGIFVNTYHMHLSPGEEVVSELGGLHKFMNYDGVIFTDSGGFQAFSLGQAIIDGVGKIASVFSKEGKRRNKDQQKLAEITDDYIVFKSHIDGRIIKLTPEMSIQIQQKLGSDIMMVLDECTSPLASYEYCKNSMERSCRWALKCYNFFKENNIPNQYLYGIIQGGHYYDLRMKSTEFICSLDFDGIAVGGSLGTSKENIAEILSWIVDYLPQDKPRHLLGIGSIPEIFVAIEHGMDTFDCIIPTRYARTGTVFVLDSPNFVRDITSKYYKNKESKRYDLPIDENCQCYTCRNYSVSYLNHLFYVGEICVMTLLTIHNLHFYNTLLKNIRKSIKENKYFEFKQLFLNRMIEKLE
ncbi:MAG: tRNA guanosine(34) transglycosylase Tgt [bacterium]|nr:tRNA guanosine(34) transglycosylase Tgt [bacterium]